MPRVPEWYRQPSVLIYSRANGEEAYYEAKQHEKKFTQDEYITTWAACHAENRRDTDRTFQKKKRIHAKTKGST